MVKHNNVIPNGHFHKYWQSRIKTWFDQVRQQQQYPQPDSQLAARHTHVWSLFLPSVASSTIERATQEEVYRSTNQSLDEKNRQ